MPLAFRLKYVSFLVLAAVSFFTAKAQSPVLHALPNGLQCAFFSDTTRILSHVSLTLRGGALLDPPDADGLNNLYAHLLADRSDSLPADGRILPLVLEQGMAFNHVTFAEGTFFSFSTLPGRFATGMGILSRLIQYPGADSASLQRAMGISASEIQFLEGQPQYFHEQEMRKQLWGRQRHRKNIAGSYIQLAALRLGWIRNYLDIYLHPRNCLLAGTGNMEAESFFQLADSLFGEWKWAGTGPQVEPFAPPKLDGPHYFVTENAYAEQPVLSMAWPVPGAETQLQLPEKLQVFAAMADLRRGRFHRELLEGGLAREMAWEYAPTWAPGAMTLRVMPVPDSLVPCLRAVRDLLWEMKTKDDFFTRSDRRAARRVLQLHKARRHDRSLDRLASVGQAWVRGILADDPLALPPASTKDLNDLSQRFAPDAPHVTGLLHNARVDLLAGLESIFREGQAIAANTSQPEDTLVTTVPDSVISLVGLPGFRIYFESASFQPDGPSLLNLDTVAVMLHTYPDLKVYVNGFADGQGDGVYNYKLSIERARSVEAVLSSAHQIDPERLVVRPFGEAFPEYPDDTPEHRALNRRVTFNIAPPDAVENAF